MEKPPIPKGPKPPSVPGLPPKAPSAPRPEGAVRAAKVILPPPPSKPGPAPSRPLPAVSPQVAPAIAPMAPLPKLSPQGPAKAPGAKAPAPAALGPPSVAPLVKPLVKPLSGLPPKVGLPAPLQSSAQVSASGAIAALTAAQVENLGRLALSLSELDYFQILNIDPGANPGEIKTAFYKESRMYHPDRFFHLDHGEAKKHVGAIYKRITEAYFVLRDDAKRRKYLSDMDGSERSQKLRFTEADEAETRAVKKKEQDEQIGTHPHGRRLYLAAAQDAERENWSAADRNLKLALTYEPQNARYRELSDLVGKKLAGIMKIQ